MLHIYLSSFALVWAREEAPAQVRACHRRCFSIDNKSSIFFDKLCLLSNILTCIWASDPWKLCNIIRKDKTNWVICEIGRFINPCLRVASKKWQWSQVNLRWLSSWQWAVLWWQGQCIPHWPGGGGWGVTGCVTGSNKRKSGNFSSYGRLVWTLSIAAWRKTKA